MCTGMDLGVWRRVFALTSGRIYGTGSIKVCSLELMVYARGMAGFWPWSGSGDTILHEWHRGVQSHTSSRNGGLICQSPVAFSQSPSLSATYQKDGVIIVKNRYRDLDLDHLLFKYFYRCLMKLVRFLRVKVS